MQPWASSLTLLSLSHLTCKVEDERMFLCILFPFTDEKLSKVGAGQGSHFPGDASCPPECCRGGCTTGRGSFSGRMWGVSQGSRSSDTPVFLLQKTHRFIYYPDTGWAVGAEESDFEGWAFPFPGVTLIEDFVTPEEEAEIVQLMDRDPWKLSQSGRRKQVGWARAGWGEEGLPSLASHAAGSCQAPDPGAPVLISFSMPAFAATAQSH